MSEHEKHSEAPVGLGIDRLDDPAVETEQIVIEEQREVDPIAAEDITDETAQHNLPLLVLPEGQTKADDSQPGSAFSSSSSEEDDDADDEAGEDDEEADEEADEDDDTAEWNASPLPTESVCEPPHQAPPPLGPPAVWGRGDKWSGEYTLRRHRRYEWQPYHDESSSDPEDVKAKQEAHRQTPPNHPARPSPLRSTSGLDSPTSPPPVSPLSQEEQENLQDIGVLPEPSPELPKVYEFASFAASQQTPSGERRTSAASFDWSEDDEDDDSWVAGAIQDVKGQHEESVNDRRVVLYQAPGDSQTLDTINETEDEDFMTADEKEPESSNDAPVTEDGTSTEESSNAFVHSQQRPSGLGLSSENPEGGTDAETYVSQDGPGNTSEQSDEELTPTQAPAGFNPTFEGAQAYPPENLVELTSPNLDGPEPLTGLAPHEGLDAWWEWRTRNQKITFRTNHNPLNKDKHGDLSHQGETNPDRSDAADFLSKQRFILKELAASEGRNSAAQRASNIRQDMEDTMEYLKLKMLYYRAQRNHFLYETHGSRGRIARRDNTIRELEERNGQRKDMIKKLEDRNTRRDEEIKGLEENIDEYSRALKDVKARYEALQPMLEEFQTEMQKRKDALEKERTARKDLQLRYGNLNQMFEQLKKAAEINAEEVRVERAKREQSSKSSPAVELRSQGTNTPNWDDTPETTQFLTMRPAENRRKPRSAEPSTGAEQLIRWPLSERTQLVPFMVEWINDHREQGSLEEPLSPGQLDDLLGVGSLSWTQLINELKKIGYVFRPDHLAAALSDPEAISAGQIPRPNSAVMYAARRLSPNNAVPELLHEVSKLQQELEGVRMPQQVVTHIHELETENRRLLAEQDEGRQFDSGAIQSILSRFVENTDVPQDGKDESTELQEKLTQCHQHGERLQTEVETLTRQLKESEEAFTLMDTASADLKEQIEELEEKLRLSTAGGDDDESGRSEKEQLQDDIDVLRSELREQEEIEEELIASREQCKALQSRINELEASVPSSKGEEESDPSEKTQLQDKINFLQSLLKEQVELEEELAASQAHSKTLQSRINELESSNPSSNPTTNEETPTETQTLLEDLQTDLTNANEANENLLSELSTLQAQFDSLQEQNESNEASQGLLVKFELLQTRFDELQQRKDELLDRNAELEDENATSKEQIETARADFESLQEEIEEFYAHASEDVVHQEKEKLSARNAELEREVKAAHEELEGLQEQIDEISAEFAQHVCSASPASPATPPLQPAPKPPTKQTDASTQTPDHLPRRPLQPWAQRERAIKREREFLVEENLKRVRREQRHAAERERLAALRRAIDEQFEAAPGLRGGWVGVVAAAAG